MEEESPGRETAPPPPAPQTTDLEDTYALVALQGGGGGGGGSGDGCGLRWRGADRCIVRRFTRRYRGVPWWWFSLNRRISTWKIID